MLASDRAAQLAGYLDAVKLTHPELCDAARVANELVEACREMETENAFLITQLPPRRMTKTYQHWDK
jgi:hypothetical protein